MRLLAFILATALAVALGISLAPIILPTLGLVAALVALGVVWAFLTALGSVLVARIDHAMWPVSRRVTARLDRWDAWMAQHVRPRLPRWAFNELIVIAVVLGVPFGIVAGIITVYQLWFR